MRTPLLLVAALIASALSALAPAARAAADEAPGFEAGEVRPKALSAEEQGEIAAAWRAGLAALPATRSHSEALASGRIPAVFVDPEAAALGGLIGEYRGGKVLFNALTLAWCRQELLSQKAAAKDVPGLIAAKTLPYLAHELRHGLTAQLRRSEGLSLDASLVEEEALGYADWMKVYAEVSAKRPELRRYEWPLQDPDPAQLKAWSGGIDAIDASLRGLMPSFPSIFRDSREDLLAYYGKVRDYCRAAPGAEDCAGGVPGMVESALKFFSDAGRWERLRSLYAALYRAEGSRR